MRHGWGSTGAARVRAGEADRYVVPYGWKRDGARYPVVWLHGAGGTAAYGPVEQALWERLLSPVILTDCGGQRTWGSDAVVGSTGYVEADRAWAVGNLGAKNGKAIVVGGSMGGLNALLYTLANPSKVAALVMFIPAFDPEYVRLNDPNAQLLNKTAIESLYGANPVPVAKQGYLRGADLAATGIPAQIWYSENDPFTPLASSGSFIDASGCEAHSLGAVGHSYNNAGADRAADFLYRRRS